MKRSDASQTSPPSGPPLLIGGHPALDFLNSILAPHEEVLDYLYNGATMREWVGTSKIFPANLVKASLELSKPQMNRLAREARVLREAFRQILLQRNQNGDKGLAPRDLKCINMWLLRNPPQLLLMEEGATQKLRFCRSPTTSTTLLGELAAHCADLLANQPPQQIHQCENPVCTLWFNDIKSGSRRRWCSMAICGNRMKVAAHRARYRSEK